MPQERGVELRLQIVGAGKEPDLRALGLIRRRKSHASAPKKNDSRRAFRDLGDKRRAGGHVDGHVRAGDDEVADIELARGVQAEPVEARDVRDRLHALDAPLGGIGFGARRSQVEAPRGQLRLDATLDEDFDQQLLPVALERQPVAFLDHDTRRTRPGGLGKLINRGRVGILDRERQERRAVTGGERLLEPRDQFLDRVGRRQRLTVGRVREREARQRQDKAYGHGWSHIRPLRGS